MRARLPLVMALIPALALVAGLPLVNRVEPVVAGLPFLLFWILAWVLATPLFLAAAYWLTEPTPVPPADPTPGNRSDGGGR